MMTENMKTLKGNIWDWHSAVLEITKHAPNDTNSTDFRAALNAFSWGFDNFVNELESLLVIDEGREADDEA